MGKTLPALPSEVVAAGRAAPVTGSRSGLRPRRELLFAGLMILPTMLVVFGVIGYPWVYSLWLSLNQYDLSLGMPSFIGLTNYLNLLSDPLFLESLQHTLVYTVECVVLSTLLGLGIALILNEKFRGRAALRSLMLVPWAMSAVVVGTIWLWLLDGSYGTINALLYRLGLIQEYIPFWSNLALALPLLGIIFLWNQAPLSALLFLAGLQSVPPNLYRSAKMDGAGAWQRFWYITLPWLRPTLSLVLILQTINSIMTFELVYIVTHGGPGTSTTLLSWLGYQTAFKYWRFGLGSAILYILSVLCLILAFGYFRLLEQRRKPARATPPAGSELARLGLATRSASMAPMSWSAAQLPRVRKARLSPRTARIGRRLVVYGGAIAIGLWSLLPVLALISWSLTPINDLLSKPAPLIPIPPSFDNYREAFFAQTIGAGGTRMFASTAARSTLLNSIVVSLSVTVIGLAVGSLGAYAFSRFSRWRSMRGIFFGLTLTRMIPGLVMVVPWFIIFKAAGLLNSRIGLVITYTSFIVPLVVWVLKGYFDTIPRSVEQAAQVDGCTRLQAFRQVVLPLAGPGLVAAAIFSFLVAWNEFVYAAMLTGTEKAQTIPVTIGVLVGVVGYEVKYFGVLFAVAVVAVIPPVLIALVLQRYLVQGMLSGSTKG